ncbi:hypothetical protein DOY81_014634 [Sarcophaga bullata]|nr:hypothetical protein DOY81_014634 [Sarcophaga bullata]
MEPQDQTAVVGALPERLIFGLGTSKEFLLQGWRFPMIGSDEEVSPGPEGQPAVRSTFAKITVLVPPEAPKISQGDVIYTTEDRKVDIECVSEEDLPQISMKLHQKEYHNTTFTCQAQNTADRTYRSAKIRLEVKYAPKVRVNVIGGAVGNGRILEHAQVRLECKADANPSDVRYKWYINDEPISGGQKTEMVIRNVTRKFHDAIVKCEVQNSIGKSEDSETLDISYGPTFKEKPRSMEADIGSLVTLNCEVDGNPTPDVVWIQHPIDRVVGASPNLTFSVSNETAGRYYCKANVPGYPEISADAYVYLKGSPTISSALPRARHVSGRLMAMKSVPNLGHDYSYWWMQYRVVSNRTLIILQSSYHYETITVQGETYLTDDIVGGISSRCFAQIITIFGGGIFSNAKKRSKLPPADENGLPSLQSTTASVVSSSPNGSCSNQSTATHVVTATPASAVDPRFSAIYGNPYLRSSNSSLLPPPTAV